MGGTVFKGEWKNNGDEGKYCSGAVIKDINKQERDHIDWFWWMNVGKIEVQLYAMQVGYTGLEF